MLSFISSPTGFIILLAFYVCGALGSLVCQKNNNLANGWQNGWGILAAGWGILFAIGAFNKSQAVVLTAQSSLFPLLSASFHIDKLAAFFIFIISLIALFCSIYGLGYIKHYYSKYNLGSLGFFYHLFIVGMILVVSSSQALFFLMAWEIMSIASYFLVVYDRNEPGNIKAGFIYLVMTHVGTVFIILAFLLMYKFTGSFDFSTIKSGVTMIPAVYKDIIFVCALIGFGTKAGIIPFHIWLPSAHPAAPSHVSALMSGVMIKTGIYMMVRLFLDVLMPIPAWWGITILIVGSASAVLGVLYALTEHDLKKLLAYHSIENIGIILLGLGSAMFFSSTNHLALAVLALVAALFHTLNHATFKSLLFLSAGSVINQTHTRNMEKYGGLIKFMPQTAVYFLIGSMAISALPPFNGFFSEWLTYQALLQGMGTADVFVKSLFVLAAGALALTGGLALACFVKAFGATFLARPRSSAVSQAKESTWPLKLGMGALAVLCLLFGVFSNNIMLLLNKISHEIFVIQKLPVDKLAINLNTVSGPAILLSLVLALLVVWLIIQKLIYKKQTTTIGDTWNCGTDPTARMEITATGFARSIVQIFSFSTPTIYQTYFYQPLYHVVVNISRRAKTIQSGNINVYVLYILIAITIILCWSLVG
ncbi:MAG: proton-conducting transporter membrane subunit [Patescibacteria group bacterium]